MSASLFGIPVDIQWKRLCFSQDMCAKDLDTYPEKWRSSLAVFYSDVSPDPNDTSDELTMYLKVVISVTGFQPEGPDIDQGVQSNSAWGSAAIGLLNQITQQYFPAYAALLQVLVVPKGSDANGNPWDMANYPYFADFEPKKREMIELASETNEALTQSKNEINVRKGLSSNDSLENLSIDHGMSGQGSFQYAGTGGSMGGSLSYDRGVKSTVGDTLENIRTIDNSIEKRESYGSTTQISNLYHQLDSYHQGMNRAVFFHNARPHTEPALYNTFVNGLRIMEGVQEHFLIVKRPMAMKNICVKAILETAHIYQYQSTTTTTPTDLKKQQTSKRFGLSAEGNTAGSLLGLNSDSDTMDIFIPAGYQLDPAYGNKTIKIHGDNPGSPGGWDEDLYLPPGFELNQEKFDSEKHQIPSIQQISEDQWRVSMTVSGWAGTGMTDGHAWFTVIVHFIEIPTTTTATEDNVDLFLTGRSVSSCADNVAGVSGLVGDYVSYESNITDDFKRILAERQLPGTPDPRGPVSTGNELSRMIKTNVIHSFRKRLRYAPYSRSFYQTQMVAKFVSTQQPTALKTSAEMLHQWKGLDKELAAHIERNAPKLTVSQALQYNPEKLAETLNTSVATASRLHQKIIGLK